MGGHFISLSSQLHIVPNLGGGGGGSRKVGKFSQLLPIFIYFGGSPKQNLKELELTNSARGVESTPPPCPK